MSLFINSAVTFPRWLSDRSSKPLVILVEKHFKQPDTGTGTDPSEGLLMLFLGLLLVFVIPLSIFLILKIIKYIRLLKDKGIIEEMLHEAQKNEKAGEFVSAALIYEKLKNFDKAAGLYEKGGDFIKAAAVYEIIGQMKKVKETYEKAGDFNKAAETCISMGDYIEAARIYSQKGDKLMTAQMLEISGNKLAAVRAYREEKDYFKASMLLKEEGMHKEAAEMYKISLTGEDIQISNIDKYYTYAALLKTAGDLDEAYAVFKEIISIDPDYGDVREKLEAMDIQKIPGEYEDQKEESLTQKASASSDLREDTAKRETTLRSLIQAGRIEPRYCLRLWVQILKAIGQKHKQGIFLGNLSPESISIDTDNNVMFIETLPKNPAYCALETISGGDSDQISVIYSMGIILYEMLTGSLDLLGIKKLGEVIADVPPWLEDLTMKCVDKDRGRRYQSLDEIFSALTALKNKRGDSLHKHPL